MVEITKLEWYAMLHGMVFGAIYLLAFTGGFLGLWQLKPGMLTAKGEKKVALGLQVWMWMITLATWVTVLSGTYWVYPTYRAPIPTSPRSLFLADPSLAPWHTFGMEWKEHIGWLCPFIITAVSWIISQYGKEIKHRPLLRKGLLTLFILGFIFAGISGVLGAFITKIHEVR